MMDAVHLIRRLREHQHWVNRKLLAAASELSPQQLHQEFQIGRGTIWKTLLHLYAAEYVWLGALEGDPRANCPGDEPGQLPGSQTGPGAVKTLDELSARWAELEKRWDRYVSSLTDAALSGMASRTSTSSRAGMTITTPRSDILMHVSLHAQYTTAQLTNMLRHAGRRELPDVMLITLSRQQHAPD